MRAFVIAGRWFLILALCSMMALFATTLASLCLPAHSFLRTGLDIEAALLFTGLALTVLCNLRITFLHQRSAATDSGREHAVLAPTTGRWVALNSPASKVPSHNWLLGQAYAIDLVAAPSRQEVSEGAIARPDFFRGSPFKPPRAYPAFGMPVRAMVDGVVVSSEDRYRDHRARSRWIGFIYLMAEDAIRSLGPVGWLLGNHVTIRTDSGIYALVAHLQHGSIRVKVGQRVRAGEVIGGCGNSGNSSEPHVHAQLMDRAEPPMALGLPISFIGARVESAEEYSEFVQEPRSSAFKPLRGALPCNGEALVTPAQDCLTCKE